MHSGIPPRDLEIKETRRDKTKVKGLIRRTTDLDEAVCHADLVVESVPEDLNIKQAVFKNLGEKAPPETIFATNSSSMPVSLMQDSSERPEKCLNTLFLCDSGRNEHGGCHGWHKDHPGSPATGR